MIPQRIIAIVIVLHGMDYHIESRREYNDTRCVRSPDGALAARTRLHPAESPDKMILLSPRLEILCTDQR